MFDGLDADGKPTHLAADHAPTMRELMTHTAGLSYGFDPARSARQALPATREVWQSGSLAEMVARKVASLPLAYQPGAKWLYSLSMDIQGAIIERLTRPVAAASSCSTRIFEPLGMVDTAFHTPPEKRRGCATLYRWQQEPRPGPARQSADARLRHAAGPGLGGGGLVSTVADYARFAQMLLNGGELAGARIVSARGAEAADRPTTCPTGCWPAASASATSRSAPASATASTARCSPIRPGRHPGRRGDLPVGRRGRHLVLGRPGQRPALRRHDPAALRDRAAAAGDDPDADGGRDPGLKVTARTSDPRPRRRSPAVRGRACRR